MIAVTEPFSQNIYFLIVAGIALLEIGANAAIIETFYHRKLNYPITMKMLAASVMLAYIALSVLFGNPATWRVDVAFVAVAVDGFAIYRLWRALRRGESLDGVDEPTMSRL